jgi:hypothetical protein
LSPQGEICGYPQRKTSARRESNKRPRSIGIPIPQNFYKIGDVIVELSYVGDVTVGEICAMSTEIWYDNRHVGVLQRERDSMHIGAVASGPVNQNGYLTITCRVRSI